MVGSFFKYIEDKNPLDIVVCENEQESKKLCSVLEFFKRDYIVFPDFRAIKGDDLRVYQKELHQLFASLKKYYDNKNKPIIISPLKTLLYNLPKKELFSEFSLSFGQDIDLDKLKSKLLYWGYEFVDIVELPGEVSFRGDIIDIYSPNAKLPYRISLFDTEIEEIKEFELDTQRTKKDELDSVTIIPAFLSLNQKQYEEVLNRVVNSKYTALNKDIASLGFWHLDDLAGDFLKDKKIVLAKDLSLAVEESYALSNPNVDKSYFLDAVTLKDDEIYKEIAPIDVKTLLNIHKDKKRYIISANEATLKQHSIFNLDDITYVKAGYILNLVTPDKLIVSLNKEVKKTRRKKATILLDDLKKGDYVVHEDYGVGVFKGIEKTEILGGVKDFVVISYQGDDRVMLPVENLDMIDRYIASSGSVPVVDKLGKGGFSKLKENVRRKLFEIASKLINIAAKRELIKAPKLEFDYEDIKKFQQKSGFVYTDDQLKAVDDIISDLRSQKVMDRLLSGDVGFGKTEVAMNAIYATYKAGYQSAFIVPTTLLSSQHYRTLKDRLEKEGVKVAKFDRFTSSKEKSSIKKALKEGEIDLVIGTHALFNLEFKNLALVIVDEEHKFGVKQKEKIKELYHNVHMLSMSATPIPRSLNQALSKIKSMSELLTPPSIRQDIRTFVKEWDEKLVKEVILRELRRGGQVFYVHNSIENMRFKLKELEELLPSLRILVLHSKVNSSESEKEILRFEAGEYDLLLATSIVESGIHMPRVNTIIVDGADRFGIADLHQLRGRVGRKNVEGFAYFLVNDKENITDEAKKRLLALESNSYLGSGSVLAHHDLEIRGGGNLVGDAQSGHIKNIGYSLYLKMLEDAIRELSNESLEKEKKVDIKLSISAYISDELVSEDRLRVDLYRRLSLAKDVSEVYEIEEEIEDRFGKLDTPTKQFIDLVVIKILSLKKGIKTIMNYTQNITFIYEDGSKKTLKSKSKDDFDILDATLRELRAA